MVSHLGPPTAASSTASARRQASSTSSVSAVPWASIDAPPTTRSSSSKSPSSASTTSAADMISGPIPSPGSVTMRLDTARNSPIRSPAVRIARGSDEFSRVLAFSDGMFAIARTLLVVGIGVPELRDEGSVGELWDDFGDLYPEILSFFISFAVIGRYWVAHHRFFARVAALNYRSSGRA